ncbi:hypothetical protein GTG28_20840 [Vibrio sp. OCN044]|uniref:Uncharacterized protein n=1 Tax=Vibrio tetraodonis subsp. pristinus TaxID=2695891 RepID=A0A6L8M6C4_9VIBR|nr:hypothetical protein [Vibrio tetraodonis]MYM61652.1 hypothetical protein [Vibrio tetraodonis subsp. pristinus]
MWEEQDREEMRTMLITALSESVSMRSAGLDIGASMSNPANSSTKQNVFCSETRPRGESKIICSWDVFDHLKLKRLVDSLSEIERNWIYYRYGDKPEGNELDKLVEVVFDWMDNKPERKDGIKTTKKLLAYVLRSRREVNAFLQSKAYEEIQVSRQVYLRNYKVKKDEFENHLERFDRSTVDRILTMRRVS